MIDLELTGAHDVRHSGHNKNGRYARETPNVQQTVVSAFRLLQGDNALEETAMHIRIRKNFLTQGF